MKAQSYKLSNSYDRIALNSTHYNDVIMSAMGSQITDVSIVCSTVGTGPGQRKHQSSVSRAFVRGIHRWPVNSPHKRPVTRKLFPFDDVIMCCLFWTPVRRVVPEAGINNRAKQSHPTVSVGCNYLCLPLIPVSDRTLLTYCLIPDVYVSRDWTWYDEAIAW